MNNGVSTRDVNLLSFYFSDMKFSSQQAKVKAKVKAKCGRQNAGRIVYTKYAAGEHRHIAHRPPATAVTKHPFWSPDLLALHLSTSVVNLPLTEPGYWILKPVLFTWNISYFLFHTHCFVGGSKST
jgi:hypothetical protein